MTLKVVKDQILKFVSQSTPSVMAIKGEWGVGKTFSWNKFLDEAKQESMISASRYSYVSLFGISSLEKLKQSIFENAISKESIGNAPSLETLSSNTKGMLETLGRSSLNKLRDLPYLKVATPAIEAWSFMSISQYLICIDDLERKGTALEIKEVLGLISLLKEQKKCKVVLLLNDGTNEVKDYEKFKEKVIDVELQFSPLPHECAKIAYDGSKEYHKDLSEYSTELGIKNIRILNKIERSISSVWRYFDDSEADVKVQFLKSVTLMSWAYYCSKSDSNVPNLEFIESLGSIYSVGGKDATEEEKKWKEILLSFNFISVNELDKKIASLVRHGYVDGDELTLALNEANSRSIQFKKSNSFRKAWETFHDSFNDNEDEVIESFYSSLKENVSEISPNDLDSVIGVLRFLGYEVKASELIDFYVDERRSTPEIFNLNSFDIYRPLKDEVLKLRFEKAFSESVPKRSLQEVLEFLSGRNGWNDEDVDVLDDASIEDYYNFFKSLSGPHLTSTIATSLKFSRIGNASEKMISITHKVKVALQKIADESKLNKLRMEKFNF
ncbi:P-loop NTPase fold protein [Pantoea leporis]|uniref:P-loop NTPase fold protein n=1 Tax=Pantoea leporis TaxID=2933780 RepID=UPI002302C7E8|nr:P-loop NTPase fold protein [Pantoea leporis]